MAQAVRPWLPRCQLQHAHCHGVWSPGSDRPLLSTGTRDQEGWEGCTVSRRERGQWGLNWTPGRPVLRGRGGTVPSYLPRAGATCDRERHGTGYGEHRHKSVVQQRSKSGGQPRRARVTFRDRERQGKRHLKSRFENRRSITRAARPFPGHLCQLCQPQKAWSRAKAMVSSPMGPLRRTNRAGTVTGGPQHSPMAFGRAGSTNHPCQER